MSQTFVQGIVVLLLWLMRLSLQQEYAGYSKYKNSDQLVFLNFGYVRNGLRFVEVKRNCFGWQSGNIQPSFIPDRPNLEQGQV